MNIESHTILSDDAGTPLSTPVPDSHLGNRSAKEHWKTVAEFMNAATGGSAYRSGVVDVSPNTLGHLFDSGTGAAGAFFARTTDAIAKTVQGEDLPDRKVPFYRKVSGEVMPYEDTTKFYNRRDEIQKIKAEYKSLDPKQRQAYKLTGDSAKLKLVGLATAHSGRSSAGWRRQACREPRSAARSMR